MVKGKKKKIKIYNHKIRNSNSSHKIKHTEITFKIEIMIFDANL